MSDRHDQPWFSPEEKAEQLAPWGRETPRSAAFLLHFSIFLAVLTVILWPGSSYVAFFRYGNVPILYEFAAFVLPLAVALGSTYQGILTTPPALRTERSTFRRFTGELLGALSLAAVTVPMVAITGSVSRASLLMSGRVLLILTTTALAFRPLGMLIQALARNRSLQYILMWVLVLLILYLTAIFLPIANPIVGVTNAAEATRIGGSSVFYAEIPAYRAAATALLQLLFAGILSAAVVLFAYTVRPPAGESQ